MSSDEARAEAERRYRLWLPTGDYEIDRENYSELDAEWQNAEAESQRQAFEAGAEWQAERDAGRIAELEADNASERRLREQIRRQRDRAVDKLRPVGQERDAWQERAEAAEAKLAEVRERLVHLADAQQSWINAGRHEQAISREAIRDRAREIVAVIDGEVGS